MSLRHALAPVALLAACDTPSVAPVQRPAAATSSTVAPTAWGYTNVYELTPAGPVLFLDGVETHAPLCQGPRADPTAAKPPGWSSFPKDLQEVLCGG